MTTFEEQVRAGNAPAWRPDQDDPEYIEGVVSDIARGQNEYGTYPIVTVRAEDGTEKAVHAFATVLRNELLKTRPQIGETIGILFQGDIATKPGSKFKSYKGYVVKVKREGGDTFDWGTLGAPEDPGDFAADARVVYDTPENVGEDDVPF